MKIKKKKKKIENELAFLDVILTIQKRSATIFFQKMVKQHSYFIYNPDNLTEY